MNKLPKFAIFLSGKGSNFVSILDAISAGKLYAEVVLLITNNPEAGGLKVALDHKIPTAVIDRGSYVSGEQFSTEMLALLRANEVDLIVLAGYMRKIPPAVIKAYPKRMVNIHPALLPKFGGKGMYGHYVHEAVIASNELESGATVHYVDEIYDNGAIIGQKKIKINPNETPESLAARVLEIEHQFYPEILQLLVEQQNWNNN